MSDSNGDKKLGFFDQLRESMRTNDEWFAAAAKNIDREAMIDSVVKACSKTEKLRECSIGSVLFAASEAASFGFYIGGVTGFAYLVPYKGKAQLQIGYQGLIKLGYDSGVISLIDSQIVYKEDEYSCTLGTRQRIRHVPSLGNPGPARCYYSVIWVQSGRPKCRQLTHEQALSHMAKHAKGYDRADSAWKTNFDTMALKTVTRMNMKLIPLSDKVREVLNREEYSESAIGEPEELTLPSGSEVPMDDLDQFDEPLDPAAPTEAELVAAGLMTAEIPIT